MVALSTLTAGSTFSIANANPVLAAQKYVLTRHTGSAGTKLICYNMSSTALQEVDNTTLVTEVTPTVTLYVGITV